MSMGKAERRAAKAGLNERGLLTKSQAAEYLSIGETKLKELIATNVIVPIDMRGMLRIKRADLDEFIDECPSAMTPSRRAKRAVTTNGATQ